MRKVNKRPNRRMTGRGHHENDVVRWKTQAVKRGKATKCSIQFNSSFS